MEKVQTVSRRKADAGKSLLPVDFEKARIEHAQAQKEDTRLLGEVAQRKHEAGIAEQVTPASHIGFKNSRLCSCSVDSTLLLALHAFPELQLPLQHCNQVNPCGSSSGFDAVHEKPLTLAGARRLPGRGRQAFGRGEGR